MPRSPNSDECLGECTACREPKEVLWQVPCGCWYCRDCLRRLVEISALDRFLWPPSCCKIELDEASIAELDDDKLLDRYSTVRDEMSTMRGRPDDTRHCWKPSCHAELAEDAGIEGSNAIVCYECGALTCTNCGREHHPNELACRASSIDEDLREAIGDNWQACEMCGWILTREEGCNRIRCLCGNEFC
ncbi:hypothetical protein GGS23DRAFT_183720 [Durotheca rogersii]|uniref:uncharacterized protein n=1 Tax=Durotheca rogersii TaxID=419775 RepID=UPI00221F081C|nr:uncharacterized protein GGS23DRAFT_183720 [Durotheca rogersii]KAI5867579.1 hypothetical protein GGS23DRAFT_183720 [Durotheca rogersii]